MKVAQLLLAYQRLVDKETELRGEIERAESRLTSDPDVTSAEEQLTQAREAQQAVALRLRESDREREAHRTRLRSREKELMSGRIRNPSELMQMNEEVQHMKASFAEEEEAELQLMEEGEAADEAVRRAAGELEAAKSRLAADEPALRKDIESWQEELASVMGDSAAAWAQIPPDWQSAYRRVRVHPAVAEVDHNQCLACHVTVTSFGMQALRKGEDIVHCDNCGRILVIA